MRAGFREIGLALVVACAPALAQDGSLRVASKNALGSERRIALVIGNAAYKDSPLRNPVNDARAIAEALAATGFAVTVIENATETGMRRAIRAFGDELQHGGVGLFYYAGHGIQVGGRNYLIPVNADIQREDEVEDQAVDANLVLAKMDTAKNSLNLMILDACRNNPFARSFRSSARGLAQMDAPSGTLVAFATAPGSVAADGDGDNGLYTKHLLANMRRPGLPIEQVFKEVRIGVGRETGDRQIPWESSSLRGDFFFVAPDPASAQAVQQAAVQRAVAEAVRLEQQKLAAEQRKMQDTIREMLARQRAELEEEMRRRAEALGVKPSAALPVAAAPGPELPAPSGDPLGDQNDPLQQSTQVASVAPAPVAAETLDPRLPKVGDRWEYRYTELMTREKKTHRAEVVGVSKDGILDEDDFSLYGRGVRAHGSNPELLILDPVWVFSPYLQVFEAATPGARWDDIRARNDRFCARIPSCRYSAEVIGTEKLVTPAGSFDTVKVTVDLYARMGGVYVHRRASFWYAEAAKRLVKSTVRTFSQGGEAPDYDLELVSYKLN